MSPSPRDVSRPLSVAEIFGLHPLSRAAAQARLLLAGDPSTPPSRFDRTSLRIFTPRLSVRTWLGQRAGGRLVPVLNLPNRTPTPADQGWSVRFTQVRDYRGRALAYDSHNGTDFVVPPGTVVVTAAPGRVVHIRHEWNRGGLKIYVDHGHGVMTASNHLGRALVSVGDTVGRGTPIALSAYSGADGFFTFPWVAPHVHFNVVLGGRVVDPFAAPGETTLWRSGHLPVPAPRDDDARVEPTVFEPAAVDRLLADIRQPEHRAPFESLADPTLRGFALLVESTVYPTRFRTPDAGALLHATPPARAPLLDLPFQPADFDGMVFADDAGWR